jgi:hypothetical protein
MRQSYMHIRRRVIVAALAGALSAPALVAQPRVDVTTRIGGLKFDRAASLETSAFLGLDATYRINPNFSLGSELNVTQAKTTAEDFITSLTFGVPLSGDTTTFFGTGQAANVIQASLMGVFRASSGRLVPFALAGAGYYGIFLDPQINRGSRQFNGFSGTVGGGILYQLSQSAGIQLDVRDLIFTSYEANRLDPANGRNPNIWFIEDFAPPPDRKSTVHNIAFSLGFRYTPQGSAGDLPPAEDPDEVRRENR